MKTDGLFDFRVVEIPASYNKPLNLIFRGDIHFNSPAFADERFDRDNEDLNALCKKQDTYFISTGDVFEALSTSERFTFQTGNFHESNRTRWEKEYAREIDNYVKRVPFTIGRTLAVYGGNHFFQFYNGTTSDMALASKLEAPYIGCSGYLILSLRIDKYHTHIVKIFVHHGLSSGRKVGSGLNKLEDAAAYFHDADILVMGHDHKTVVAQLPALSCEMGKGGHWKIKECQRIIGRAGSYLKAYEPGKSSYAVDAMFRPSTLGYLHVIVTPRRISNSRKNLDERWIQMQAMI